MSTRQEDTRDTTKMLCIFAAIAVYAWWQGGLWGLFAFAVVAAIILIGACT